MKRTVTILCTVAGLAIGTSANAAALADEVAEIRQMMIAMQRDYETRIAELESRLTAAEQRARKAERDAGEAYEIAEQTAIDRSSGAAAANTFNPSVGAVLSGRYASLDRSWDEIPGILSGGEIGSGEAGFALGEAEINFKANVDANYFGSLTFALASEDGGLEVELEDAWLQTTALPAGLSVTGGRFFSAAGYLNAFHRHADDFADRPLPYQAFFGGQYLVDGVRASWIAPTPLFFEIGTELNWGGGFPSSANATTSPAAWTAYAHLGGDVGVSNSWQLGVSRISADAIERSGGHHEQEGDAETFTGDSDLTVFDVVWKWAPGGNSAVQNVKVQGEFFRRSESGDFDGLLYEGDQDGWYLQTIWQFAPRWRLGLRHDTVNADNSPLLAGTELEDPGRSSSRNALMVDWSPSEYSRLRLQYSEDRVLPESDSQWLLQYIMSIGAHGAHQF